MLGFFALGSAPISALGNTGASGTAAGVGTATGVLAAVSAATGTALGSSSALSDFTVIVTATGTSSNDSTVLAVGQAFAQGEFTGSSSGNSTALGAGAATSASTGTSSGTSAAVSAGSILQTTTGTATGSSIASAAVAPVVLGSGTGSSSGTSSAAAFLVYTIATAGLAEGNSEVVGSIQDQNIAEQTGSIVFTYSNITGVSFVGPDILEDITDPEELNPYMPSVGYADNFSVDVEMNVVYENQLLGSQTLPASFVLIDPIPGFSITRLSDNRIRIRGNRSAGFGDKYFFVLDDGSISQGTPASVDFKALVEYQMPVEMSRLASQFLIVGTPPNPWVGGPALSINTELRQWAHWSTGEAEENIQRLVAEGI